MKMRVTISQADLDFLNKTLSRLEKGLALISIECLGVFKGVPYTQDTLLASRELSRFVYIDWVWSDNNHLNLKIDIHSLTMNLTHANRLNLEAEEDYDED